MTELSKCAVSPCATCPYRRDVPSGVWAANEYEKLPGYDGDPLDQLIAGATAPFFCHQRDGQLCAGWVGCHDMSNTVAAVVNTHRFDPSVFGYVSPVPLFASGAEAAAHGMRDIDEPGEAAATAIRRLQRKLGKVN
jgi:hypothetical protein